MRQYKVSGFSRSHAFVNYAQLFVESEVGLDDRVAILFPSRKVERMRLVLRRLCAFLKFLDRLLNRLFRPVLPNSKFRISGIGYFNVIDDAAAFDLAIGRFDETEFVDSRKARQR